MFISYCTILFHLLLNIFQFVKSLPSLKVTKVFENNVIVGGTPGQGSKNWDCPDKTRTYGNPTNTSTEHVQNGYKS